MKDIQGYEGLYFACDSGRIFANPSNKRPKGCFLSPWLIGNGYEMVMLYKDRVPKKFLIHRLIAQSFVPNPNNLPEVNHKNGNRRDNRPENLEWCTSKQNKRHAWNKGLYTHSKLTSQDIREIRKLYKSGLHFQYEIAKKFKVSQANISWIVRGLGWNRIT